jgi:hypothetical protein
MPGALVLLNATYTLLRHGALRRPPEWAIAAAQILVLVVASALLARLSPLRAALVGLPLAALLFMPTALYLFRRGIWLDFAVPLLLVQLLSLANRQLERRAARAAGRAQT